MTTDDARRGTGCIQKNSIERPLVPPGGPLAHVGGDESRRASQTSRIVPHSTEPRAVDIQRGELDIRRMFEQMSRFPAGGRARIENAHARLGGKQWGSELRPGILHGETPLG